MVTIKGGDKLASVLAEIATNASKASSVNIGFLEGSTYPDGTSLPMVAAIQEYGGRIEVPAHEVTVYRQVNKAGTAFNKKGRFVKQEKSNFATTHTVEAHTIVLPPRPFFRLMIEQKSPEWPNTVADLLVENKYDAEKTLKKTGASIKGQLQQSIADFDSVPLSPKTIAAKGFAKQLIDSDHMKKSVDYEVKS